VLTAIEIVVLSKLRIFTTFSEVIFYTICPKQQLLEIICLMSSYSVSSSLFFLSLLFLVFKLVYCAGIVGIWQHRADFSSPWNGAYYGGQVYDGYGYALPPPHDPSTYAAAYGAYPMYGNHQQQVS
jgi:hypothetical protein